MAPINLKTISSVKPMMRKGNKMSQMIGRTKIIASANGQQRTNRIHQRIRAMSVFISKAFCNLNNNTAKFENGQNESLFNVTTFVLFIFEQVSRSIMYNYFRSGVCSWSSLASTISVLISLS